MIEHKVALHLKIVNYLSCLNKCLDKNTMKIVCMYFTISECQKDGSPYSIH